MMVLCRLQEQLWLYVRCWRRDLTMFHAFLIAMYTLSFWHMQFVPYLYRRFVLFMNIYSQTNLLLPHIHCLLTVIVITSNKMCNVMYAKRFKRKLKFIIILYAWEQNCQNVKFYYVEKWLHRISLWLCRLMNAGGLHWKKWKRHCMKRTVFLAQNH